MPLIPYNNNIPNPPNDPSADVSLMQQNTNSIDQLITIDHFSFNVGTNNSGTHKQVTLSNEAAPGFAGGDGVLYANSFNVPPFGVNSWPIWQNALGSTVLITGPTSPTLPAGYTFLSGGVIMQWGQVNAPGASGSVIFPFTFPNNIFTIQLTVRRDGSTSAQGTYVNNAPTTSGFSYTGSSATAQTLFWLAIGN